MSEEKSKAPSSSEHLENILKIAYDSEFSRKQTIDGKSNNMISVAGTVTSIYAGFGLATVTQLFTIPLPFTIPSLVMLCGVSTLIVSMLFATLAFVLKSYEQPFKIDKIIKSEEKGKIIFNDDEITKYHQREPENFNRLMTKIYARCIYFNRKTNDSRAKRLLWSQICFLIGLISVPAYIITTWILSG